MTEFISHSKIIIATILIAPLAMAFLSYVAFASSPTKNELVMMKDSTVAGASDKKITGDIAKDIPMLPNSEISSFGTSNGDINLIIEAKNKENEIKTFYEDFFFKESWQQIDKNTYQKNYRTINIDISGDIVKMRISNK